MTGEPVWPIVERPVPQGDVPGEKYSPTQKTSSTFPDDVIGLKQLARYKPGPLFNPPILGNANGLLGSSAIGNHRGGTSRHQLAYAVVPPIHRAQSHVIMVDPQVTTTPRGGGAMLRAYVPAPQSGSPMTYCIDGSSTSWLR